VNMTELHHARIQAALQNLFIADSLAMPVHWFYNLYDIERAFPGGIKKLQAAPSHHPSSIMSLHSTHGGGRKGSSGHAPRELVGDVILKGRRPYWGVPGCHYHHGMQAGENTLNALCARLLMRHLSNHGSHYEASAWLQDYIDFMTADPPLHRDTYAESYHRGFFANLERGLPPEKCAALTHDTASVGGLVSIAPLYLGLRTNHVTAQQARATAQAHLQLTHPDKGLESICGHYTQLIEGLLLRQASDNVPDLIQSTARASCGLDLLELERRGLSDREIVGGKFSTACYIDGAWPSILYLLHRYREDPAAGLLANTNLGGDNVHRGAVLGVLFGLIAGEGISSWFDALHDSTEIQAEINNLIGRPRSV